MKKFKVGDRSKIIDMPEKGRHLIGKVVTIIPMGGFSYEKDDVAVMLDRRMLLLKEHQLEKILDWKYTSEGLRVAGLLALLIQAKEKGIIKRVRPIIDELKHKGFFISKDLYQDTIKKARE